MSQSRDSSAAMSASSRKVACVLDRLFWRVTVSSAAISAVVSPPSKRGYYYQVSALAGWSSLPWLGQLELPVLVMHGEDDPIIPAVNAKMLVGLLPDARLVMVDCGHLFMLTRAERVAAMLDEFLGEELAAAG